MTDSKQPTPETWKPPSRILSPEEEKALLENYLEFYSVGQLSIMYRVSVRTVYRTLTRLEAPKHGDPRRRKRRSGPLSKRKKMPKRKPPRELQPCGTNAAYQRHRKKGEYPCTPCLEAHARNVDEAKKRKS